MNYTLHVLYLFWQQQLPEGANRFLVLAVKSEVGDMRDTNSSIVRRTGEFIANALRGNNSGITSHATSSYQLMNVVNRDEGTYLHIHIMARDDIGHERHGGGDFWMATLSALSALFNLGTLGRIKLYLFPSVGAWKSCFCLRRRVRSPYNK